MLGSYNSSTLVMVSSKMNNGSTHTFEVAEVITKYFSTLTNLSIYQIEN